MIKISNLNKSFGDIKIINDLNLNLPSKKLIFITGVSGSGKSTLLKIIAGYEQQDSGTVEFTNINLKNFNNIDFVFQDYNLIKGLSALENMQVAVNSIGLKFDRNTALSILSKININEKEANTKIENLSGGEQQRIAISRSILRNSKILLADEPTGNLDFQNSEIIFRYLKDISKNKTVIIVTHDLDNAKKYGDVIIELKENKITKVDLSLDSSDVHIGIDVLNTSVSKIKSKHKFSLISKFLKVDIRKKVFQMMLVILIFVSSIIAFGTLTQFKTGVNTQTTNLKTSFLESDKIVIHNQNFRTNLKPKDSELFSNLSEVKYFTQNYFYEGAKFNFQNKTNIENLDLEFINFDDFYKSRMVDNISIGNFPKENNEIIISKKIVDELKIVNPIGKSIFYIEDEVNPIELKIAAINNIIDINGKNNSYISNQFIKTQNEKRILNSSDITLWKMIIPTVRVPFFDDKFSIYEDLIKTTKITTSEQKFPKLPKIWISEGILENETIKLNQPILTDFMQRNLDFEFFGIIKTKDKIVAVSKQIVDELSLPPISSFTLFINSNIDSNNFISKLAKQPQYKRFLLSSNSSSFIASFNRNTSKTLFIFEIILWILVAVSVIFTLGFTKIMNDAKKQEFGVLKSLGGSLKQILMYQISYFVLINIITLIISISLFVPFQMLFSSFLVDSDKIVLNYSVGYESLLIIWSIIFIISTIIYSLLSYIKFRKSISYLVT